MDKTNIKEFIDSPAGQNLKEILQSKLDELDSIQLLKDLNNPQNLAIEVKAQKKASGILRDIFSKIGTFSEKSKGRVDEDKLHDL